MTRRFAASMIRFAGLGGLRIIPASVTLAAAIAFAATAQAAVLCVSASGSVPAGLAKKLGCTGAASKTIGDAIGVASAGDTVSVLNGSYSEMVTIPSSLSGLTLTGQNAKNTIIDATGQANGIFDQASNVTISGFTIENAEHEGILVQGPAATCNGDTPPACLPAAGEITGVSISGNLIENNDKALNTNATPPTCPLVGSITPPPAFEQEDCGEGVHLDGVSFSTVSRNLITNNAGGILLTDETNANHNNLINDNDVEDNVPDCGITLPSHPPNGIPQEIGAQSFGVFDDTIADNLSKGNGAAGTGVFAPTPGTASYNHLIIDNQLIDNVSPGVIFHSHATGQKLNGTSIVGNLIEGNGAEPNVGRGETDGPADPTAIEIYADVSALPITGIKILGNTIKTEGNDIWVGAPTWNNCGDAATPCYAVAAHLNNFAPNEVGVNNTGDATAVVVDAAGNFWGCAKGPGAHGCASAVGNVIDQPFLPRPSTVH
jgi:hypothetical protein